ncbi:radical SAM family heme chaperone HemW [Pseudoflavitalea sp. X16]|uniref:radical SAM family heme chaperone HemW n=1 Tax=Paraflavitalea devenefica TaxID=2716334 RepID=UPI0014230FDE|nr:radical SAM family heme chaperone HemW [Paraflavitalea devenefica]NII23951.1 radical SAM family heme chaperone HemW [Paraflavitalea devenefica]
MAGIYIHIPFCKRACHYCNFHFSTSLGLKNDFLAALLKEIELQRNYLGNETVETIYFGGGTPSLLGMDELQSILQALTRYFTISRDAEITLEANPDDISAGTLTHWKQAGINRLSIGVQSFFEEDLEWMNRAHTAAQAIDNLQLAISYFDNITIDLIYGTPTLSDERWRRNVLQALELGIPHLSCYALTVEPKTALDTMIRKHQISNVQPDDQARQFLLLMDWAEAAGYEHYEISNFALPGHRSRHNSAYWQGSKYLGLGPSAHSFNGQGRQWNIANNALYIQSLKQGAVPFEVELLTPDQRLNEYIMTSLRTMEGLNLQHVQQLSGEKMSRTLQKNSHRFIEQQLLREEDGRLVLTKQGKLFADGIAGDLFV